MNSGIKEAVTKRQKACLNLSNPLWAIALQVLRSQACGMWFTRSRHVAGVGSTGDQDELFGAKKPVQ